MSYLLAIDYGTSFTCAAIRVAGRSEVLRIEGQTHFPSHVYLGEDGELWVGAAADNAAGRAPERFERSPKRRLGGGSITLAGEDVDPRDAVAAVLRVVLEEAMRHEGGRAPDEVRLTHPAAWDGATRAALVEAAARAGIDAPKLLSEPEAAIHHFAGGSRAAIRPGDMLAVYDLGGGTFDAAVLRCISEERFELSGPPGGTAGGRDSAGELGGEVFDRRVYEFFGAQLAERDPDAWAGIDGAQDRRHRQARRTLLADARRAKENLSTLPSADAYVAPMDTDVRIGREDFEALIAGDVRRSVKILDDTLAAAGVDPERLAGLFLTGGSSRIPLVQEIVRRLFSRADTQDDPKAIVALGAVAVREVAESEPITAEPEPEPEPEPEAEPLAAEPEPEYEPALVAASAPVAPPAAAAEPARGTGSPSWKRAPRRALLAALAALAVLGAGVAGVAGAFGGDENTVVRCRGEMRVSSAPGTELGPAICELAIATKALAGFKGEGEYSVELPSGDIAVNCLDLDVVEAISCQNVDPYAGLDASSITIWIPS